MKETCSTTGCCSKPQGSLGIRVGLLLLSFFGAMIVMHTHGAGFMGLSGSIGVDSTMWMIFLVGVVASFSTCLATTGGAIIARTDLIVDKNEGSYGLRKHQLFLHGGRMLGFVLLGGLLGFLGQTVQYSLGVSTRIQGVVGLLLLFLGLQILGFTPKFTYTSSWGNSMHAYIAKRGRKSRVTMIFGALTFLIPCGFTQMVQLTALASGSRIAGATMMGMFALGTLPGLLLLGIGTSFAKIAYKRYFERLIAVVLIIFSLNSLRGTWVILGRNDGPTGSVVQQVSQERTTIELGHDGLQLIPQEIRLEAGKNYTVVITPESDGLGCMSTITIPSLDPKIYPIQKNKILSYALENVQPGQYTFVCSSMGMEQGKIIVY